MRRRMRPLADRLRLEADLNLPVGRLAVGDQQKVEILKQLLAGARVLIFDEPTKVLAPQEAEGLFRASPNSAARVMASSTSPTSCARWRPAPTGWW